MGPFNDVNHDDGMCNGSRALCLAALSFSLSACGSGWIVAHFTKCLKDGSRCNGFDEGF